MPALARATERGELASLSAFSAIHAQSKLAMARAWHAEPDAARGIFPETFAFRALDGSVLGRERADWVVKRDLVTGRRPRRRRRPRDRRGLPCDARRHRRGRGRRRGVDRAAVHPAGPRPDAVGTALPHARRLSPRRRVRRLPRAAHQQRRTARTTRSSFRSSCEVIHEAHPRRHRRAPRGGLRAQAVDAVGQRRVLGGGRASGHRRHAPVVERARARVAAPERTRMVALQQGHAHVGGRPDGRRAPRFPTFAASTSSRRPRRPPPTSREAVCRRARCGSSICAARPRARSRRVSATRRASRSRRS